MNGAFLTMPNHQQFAFFFAAAFIVAALLLAYQGMRKRWPLLPWLTIMLWGVTCGFIGSKLILIPVERLFASLAHLHLPATSEKALLGGLIGGIIGVELSRRWLRFNEPVADAYALILPLATAIGRIGCLLGGCCFGTPSSLPWSIRYGVGSDALDAHVAHGLVAPGALSSLPVHPLQLYDIVLMLALTVFLYKARRYFRRSGSLFLLYLATYGIVRFGEEFIREGGSSVAGLKHVQWGLALGVLAALTFLVVRERSCPRLVTTTERAGTLRTVLAVAAVLLVIIAGFGWFTPLEFAIIGVHLVPLAIVALVSFVPSRQRSLLGRSTATLAAGSVLLTSGDSVPGKDSHGGSYYNLYASGTSGAFYETCGPWHRFTVGGVGFSRTDALTSSISTEYGVRGYVGTHSSSDFYPPAPEVLYSINPFVQLDWRWVGAGLGLHAGRVPLALVHSGGLDVQPQGHLWLGPRRIVFVEAAFADNVLGGVPQPWLWGGIGHEFAGGSSVMAGLAYHTGLFVESRIRTWRGQELTLYGAYLPSSDPNPTYQFGLALRYRLGR